MIIQATAATMTTNSTSHATVIALATAVLKARKGDGHGYTALFIRQCPVGPRTSRDHQAGVACNLMQQ